VQYFVHVCHLNILPKCVSIVLLFITVLHYIQSMKTVVLHNSTTHYSMAVLSSGMHKLLIAFFAHEIVKINWVKINVK